MKKLLFLASLTAGPLLFAQGGPLDGVDLTKPLAENWTSYSGDYSGRRYSGLTKVDTKNVKPRSLEWLNSNLRSGCGAIGASAAGAGETGGRGGGAATPAPN